ncbi:MAG TPA: sugar phosphate isomerase/epimerase family protein [Pirellulaceae bacterium]|nr:sugar phosphate isomerase/epimerase family protein [Pirellulaceae bacterium]
MKFAICNETFQDWPFEKAFAYAAKLGYTGIEFAPFTMHTDAYQITSARRTEVRRQAEAAGLETVGLHWLLAKTTGYYLTTPDAAVRKKTADYFGELARLCRDLGGKLLVLGSPLQRNLLPGVTHDQAMELAADCLTQAMPTIEECGVTLLIEPLGPAEGDFLNTAALGVQLCEMIASPHCRLHLDVKAMSSEAKPIEQIIRESAPWLVHFHANDANRRGPGMGEIDFHPIFRALEEINYRGWVSVEVFDYEPGVEALASQSIQYMQRVERELRASAP